MEIIEKSVEENVLKIVVSSNEESLFSLLKVYLDESNDVDIVGVYKPHHLVDKTELHIKAISKKDPKAVLVKVLKDVKKDLLSKKIK